MKKIALSFLTAAVAASSLMAENARINSLVNSPIFMRNDVASVVNNPARTGLYSDLLHVSLSGTQVDYLFGAAELNGGITLGGYVLSREAINGVDYTPHFLFSYDMGNLQVGLDLYVGRVRSKETDTTWVRPEQGERTTTSREHVSRDGDIGVTAGILMDMGGGSTLDAHFGLGRDIYKRKTEREHKSSTADNNTSSLDETKAKRGGYLFTEAVYTTSAGNGFLSLGAGLQMAVNQREREQEQVSGNQTNKTTTSYVKYNRLCPSLLVGFENDLGGGLSFAAANNFQFNRERFRDTTGTGSSTNINDSTATTFSHYLTFALEKEFISRRLFDAHYFRFGTSIYIEREIEKVETENKGTNTKTYKKERGDMEWARPRAVAGFGFEKGRFDFDLFISDLDFNFAARDAGVLGLMPVAGAALTFNFGRAATPADVEWDID